MSNPARAILLSAAAAATVLLTSGCTTTSTAAKTTTPTKKTTTTTVPTPGQPYAFLIPDLPESGFLSDYSQMTLAKEPEFAVVGRKIYVDQSADLTPYGMVVIDPLSFAYLKEGINLTDAEKERLQQYMSDWLNLKLKDRFQKVSVPGAKTLRVRTAITDVYPVPGINPSETNMADVASVVFELDLADSQSGKTYLSMVNKADLFRFTIAKEDLSSEKQAYTTWFDGLSTQMEKDAMKTATEDTGKLGN